MVGEDDDMLLTLVLLSGDDGASFVVDPGGVHRCATATATATATPRNHRIASLTKKEIRYLMFSVKRLFPGLD